MTRIIVLATLVAGVTVPWAGAGDVPPRSEAGQTLVVAGGMEGRCLWRPEEIDPTIA